MHRSLAVIAALATVASFGAYAQEVQGTEPNRGGEITYEARDPDVARERLRTAEGFEVNLFASEQEFPIGNPVSLTFDARGRMWVATMPTYPQRTPDEDPNDKIIILEDTDRDGVADKYTVFIDGLHLPTGFELGDGGAYIGQQPNLMFAKDTDGDDVADFRQVILHGFGTEDSHHSISAFTWGPGGGLYFQEGTFHHSQVETPYGPVRLVNAGIFRYKPRLFKLQVFVSYPFANPWGHIFDRWGQNFIADASGGANYFGTAITGNAIYPEKRSSMKVFTSIVRPTAGCEIISSRHFPDEFQGNFLVNNTIGFQGIKHHKMIEEGSGFTSEELEPLLYSLDINFRPVDLQFGPDGALYIVDWFNPLIGHMQYSLRDPGRDHGHGRIWRLSYPARPVVEPPAIHGQPIPTLLDLLKTYEDRTRYRVRIELGTRDRGDVATALETWIAGLDPDDPDYQHHLLEALWVYQTVNVFHGEHLRRMLESPEPKARAAATRVLRFWMDKVDDPLSLLRDRVHDDHPRVRLEALLALSFAMNMDSVRLALEALDEPTDYYLDYVLNETITTLGHVWKPALAAGSLDLENSEAMEYLLDRVPTNELRNYPPNEPVLTELVTRAGVGDETRVGALDKLADARRTEPIDELLQAVSRVDQSRDRAAERALDELFALALKESPAVLQKRGAWFRTFAVGGKREITRERAFAALIQAGDSPSQLLKLAEDAKNGRPDLIAALRDVPDAAKREAFLDHVIQGAKDDDASAAFRQSAIETLPVFAEDHPDVFELLVSLLDDNVLPETVIEAIRETPEDIWKQERLEDVGDGVLRYVRGLPTNRLSSTESQRAFALGRQVAAKLPEQDGRRLTAALANLGITVIEIRPIPYQMLFDRTEFTVPAAKPVEIRLQNTDIMPHNLVVTETGSMERVGRAAEAMSTQPGAEERNYIPDLEDVLYATRLLYPGEDQRLAFIAPEEPGDYPFVCTYPGHWITMNGVMHVVPELDETMLAANVAPVETATAAATPPTRKFVRLWEADDLLPGIDRVKQGRSLETGREMFDVAGCAKCHPVAGNGVQIGPDLSAINEKYTTEELLLHIMEPSQTVEDDYRPYLVETDDNWYSGPLVEQTDDAIRIRANPLDPQQITTIPREDVRLMEKQDISPMPTDLLITLTKDEIYDLLAYLESGGTGAAGASGN